MLEPMTRLEAGQYAPQWGSCMRASDPGACMYGDLEERETARLCLAHLPECVAIATAGDCCDAGGPCEPDLESLERLRLYLQGVVRARFRVTYDIVTPESAEVGDVEESGFIDAHGWRIPARIGRPASGVAMPLREALQHFGGVVEDSGNWLSEADGRPDFATGASERRALHPPEGVSKASYGRLKRLLGDIA